jgi:quercetin dioxygenase-like cupin family protein
MKVANYRQISQQPVRMEGAQGCQIRWLVGEEDGAPNFAMRQFELEPGGFTPRHHHPYEHEVFVLEGEGVVLEGDREHALRSGDVVFVPPNEVHQFRNTGHTPLKFLCLIPKSATGTAAQVVPECSTDPAGS